jgi:hypothetical protein
MLHDGVLIEQLAKGRYHQPPAMWKSVVDRIRRWTPDRWLMEQGISCSWLLEVVMEGSEGVLREARFAGFPHNPQQEIVRFRRTKGQSRLFKRTPSIEAMLNSWLPLAPLEVADKLAGFEQLSISDAPPLKQHQVCQLKQAPYAS